MKTLLIVPFFCIALSSTPSGANDARTRPDFVIDPSKHYVYLKFDHVGDREPLSADEPSKGLWLRLVNNCRLPIAVAIFNTENAEPNPGIGLFDEVVSQQMKGSIVHFETPGKIQAKPPSPPEQEPPEGYPLPHVFSTTTIPPGENLLFNLPLNHVGPSWYLQVRFYFELPGGGYGSGPYSVVSFDWQDIPEKLRAPSPSPLSPKGITH
jgi:hypothetical protein